MGWYKNLREKAARKRTEKAALVKAGLELYVHLEQCRKDGIPTPIKNGKGWILLGEDDDRACENCSRIAGTTWRTKKDYNAYKKAVPGHLTAGEDKS